MMRVRIRSSSQSVVVFVVGVVCLAGGLLGQGVGVWRANKEMSTPRLRRSIAALGAFECRNMEVRESARENIQVFKCHAIFIFYTNTCFTALP